MKKLEAYGPHAFAALRVVSGLMFAVHGAQKVLGVLGSQYQPPLLSQMGLGGLIELVGGLMIAVGVGTRWAAFISSGTMAVAYTQFHWKGQLGLAFFPHANKGELALLYAFVFLYIACRGSGRWAVKPD